MTYLTGRSTLANRCALALVAGLAIGLFPGLGQAQGRRDADTRTNGARVLAAFRDVVAQPSQSTVRIRCDGKEVALGTVVGADGWIVTKFSEIKGPIVCQFKEGRELPARITGVHEAYDLVLLKVEAKDLRPVQWADVKNTAVGNFVATPGPGTEPVAVGVVSVKARKVTARDMPPANGNSGYLGIQLEQAEKGAKIALILSDSAAARAGFKVNDTILAVAGQLVRDPETVIGAIQRYKVGEVVTLKVKRGEEEVEIKATLGKRPKNERSDVQNSMGSELSNRRGGFPSILQHDTVLKPRECGGPLVDLDGKALGVNIARAGRTETYAVPADALVALLPELKTGKLLPTELRDDQAKQDVSKEKIAALKAALEKAEADLKLAEKRIKELRAALEKAQTEAKVSK